MPIYIDIFVAFGIAVVFAVFGFIAGVMYVSSEKEEEIIDKD